MIRFGGGNKEVVGTLESVKTLINIFENNCILYKVYLGGKFMTPKQLGFGDCKWWLNKDAEFTIEGLAK